MANQPVIYFETSANTGDKYIDDVKITQTTGTQPQPDPQPDPNPQPNPNPQPDPNPQPCFTWCFW